MIDGWYCSCEIAIKRISPEITDDKSTSIQVLDCATMQQAINCVNVYLVLYRHMVALGYGPLARYAKLRVRMRRECRERFPRHRR